MAGADASDYPAELLQSVEALSRLVLSEEDVSSTLQRIVELAVGAIDGAEFCSVSLARKGKVSTVAATADIAARLDELQYETKEGPCLSTIEEHRTFEISDMQHDETWPTFSKRAAEETGIQSMTAHVLEVQKGSLAALNIMSSKKDSFTEEDISTAAIFAVQAGVALRNALEHAEDKNEIEQLHKGMETRQMIGQAVGIVMANQKVSADEAFQILKRSSQNANVKLNEIAQQMIEKPAES